MFKDILCNKSPSKLKITVNYILSNHLLFFQKHFVVTHLKNYVCDVKGDEKKLKVSLHSRL